MAVFRIITDSIMLIIHGIPPINADSMSDSTDGSPLEYSASL